MSTSLLLVLAVCIMCAHGARTTRTAASNKAPTKTVRERNLVVDKPIASSIVREYTRYCEQSAQHKTFGGASLGYITPWNSHGYNVAKMFASKFTMISPTWFDIKSENNRLKIQGEHNVDQGWMSDVREAGGENAPKIIPRFLFDQWLLSDFEALFAKGANGDDRSAIDALVRALVAACDTHGFDGVVLDAGYLGARRFQQGIVYFLRTLGEQLHAKGRVLVYVVPPMTAPPGERQAFDGADFELLAEFVDYFSMMTYDFSNARRPGANSPLPWVAQSVLQLVPPRLRGTAASAKLLIGMNMYGNHYTTLLTNGVQTGATTGGPILNNQYIDLLKAHKPKFQWDSSVGEHIATYRSGSERHDVWYPTLKSIHERLAFASEVGCGIALWEIGQGLDYFYDLL